MAITKFKITRAPVRSELEISGIPFVLNKEYPITEQFNMQSITVGVGVPYDDFGFQLGNSNDVWSQERKCTINVHVDEVTPITCSVIDITITGETDL